MIEVDNELEKARAARDQIAAGLMLPANSADPAQLKLLGREHRALDDKIALLEEYQLVDRQLKEAQSMLQVDDEALRALAADDVASGQKRLIELEQTVAERLNPAAADDLKPAIVEIRAGTGGEEAELFAQDLFRMYTRYAEQQRWPVELDNVQTSELGGLKEAIFTVRSRGAYGVFKFESGVHRVQRVPETEKQGRIHTSAASVAVFPEADETDLTISPADLRIDVYRSSGPGGQSVNTTDSAVRITHLPTNTVVAVQDEKSQLKNKEKALKILRSRLVASAAERQQAETSGARKEMIGTGDRSEKIRTYNFPQDRVTDHRVKQSWSNLKGVLAGDLAPITAALKTQNNQTNSA